MKKAECLRCGTRVNIPSGGLPRRCPVCSVGKFREIEKTSPCAGCGLNFPITSKACPGCSLQRVTRSKSAENKQAPVPEEHINKLDYSISRHPKRPRPKKE